MWWYQTGMCACLSFNLFLCWGEHFCLLLYIMIPDVPHRGLLLGYTLFKTSFPNLTCSKRIHIHIKSLCLPSDAKCANFRDWLLYLRQGTSRDQDQAPWKVLATGSSFYFPSPQSDKFEGGKKKRKYGGPHNRPQPWYKGRRGDMLRNLSNERLLSPCSPSFVLNEQV